MYSSYINNEPEKTMKLNPKQRREVIRSINVALAEYNESAANGQHPARGMRMIRISRMIANLNGVDWPQ